MRGRRMFGLVALILVLALVGAACQRAPSPRQTEVEGKPGGTLVFAAEQFPKCLNPITSCTNAQWLHWTALLTTLPQLVTLDADNNYIASPLIEEIPTLDNGGLTDDPFTVTYQLNPDAVWSDGSPITFEDVKYTWQAILGTPDAADTTGYDKIKDITGSDGELVIEFTEPFAPWKDLFGGGVDYVFKKDSDLAGDTNLSGKMQTDLAGMCGAAFCLESFTADQEMVLARNENYWEDKAFLEKIVYRNISDSTAEINAFRTDEIQAFYPQESVELAQQVKAIDTAFFLAKGGTQYQGLWFNLDQPPVNDKAVREALLFALDREAAVNQIVVPVQEDAAVNHCLLSVPGVGGSKYCPEVFETEQDAAKAQQILEAGGWAKGADGIYAKGGQRLVIPFQTTAGNKGREDLQTIFQAQAREVGIELRIDNSDPTTLFQTRMPARDFNMALFAFVASPDPSLTVNWHQDQIPTAGSPGGQNYYGWKNAKASELMIASDLELDEEARTEAIVEIQELARQDVIGIPLWAKPAILVVNESRLATTEGEFDFNPGQGGFSHQLKFWFFK